MADLNPMAPGDVPYPQYSVTQTVDLGAGGTFTKGHINTLNATGLLISTDPSSFALGLYQITADADNSGASTAENSIQVLTPRTRMIVIADDATPVLGHDVIFDDNDTDGAHVVAGLRSNALYLGKVFEIYTRNADGTRKKIPAAGDRLVIETVQP